MRCIIKMVRFFFFLLMLCTLSITGNAQRLSTQTNIDSFVQKMMQETGIVGMAAAIIIDKKIAWQKGFGYADKAAHIPFTTSTIMNTASVTKTFTGVCIMKAVEEGKVSLDEDINKYLPFQIINPHFPNEKITLRQLATHTSSLADRYPFYSDSTMYYGRESPEELGDFLKSYFAKDGRHYSPENFLKYKPGQYREYSNIAAGLAGYIIELVTHKKLQGYAKQHIFAPLKMRNTGWSLADVNLTKHTRLYDKQQDSIREVPLYSFTTYPDGGIRSSVLELSRYFITLLNNGQYGNTRILNKKSVQEMTRFHYTEEEKPGNINIKKLNQGIFWATKLGATRVGHNGSDPGVRTFMLSDLDRKIAIVIFFNTSLGEKEEGKYFDIYEALYKYAGELTPQFQKSK